MARLGDVPGVARVHVDTWRTAYRGIVPDAILDGLSFAKGETQWADYLGREDGRFLLVAATAAAGPAGGGQAGSDPAGGQAGSEPRSGQIVGFISAGPVAPSEPAGSGSDGEIYAFYILSGHQRQGIGRRLVRRAARELAGRGFRSVVAWVLAANPSRAFYAALGGQERESKTWSSAGRPLEEIAYVWPDVSVLAGREEE